MASSVLGADTSAGRSGSPIIEKPTLNDQPQAVIRSDISTSQAPDTSKASRLLALPLELRQHIYNNVFHEMLEPFVSSCVTRDDVRDIGCLCGEGLSMVNRKLYNETRHLFFKCVAFQFPNPASCKRYLDKIGHQVANLGYLSIAYKDTYEQSEELNDLFHRFRPECSLHSLLLRVISSRTSRVLPPAHPPIYLPYAKKHFPAQFYDLSWRPSSRPLAELTSIRRLCVLGAPGIGELEEAIFQLSQKIEKLAIEQKKTVKISEERRGGEWLYKLKVAPSPDDESLTKALTTLRMS